jgi:hypothetical protein
MNYPYAVFIQTWSAQKCGFAILNLRRVGRHTQSRYTRSGVTGVFKAPLR